MKKVALVTFGCAKNLVDSEVMAGYLGRAGYRFVGRPADADIIILNTCGFIRPSRDEADDAIRDALALKAESPARKVIVSGCYPERNRPELAARYPGVDAWIGVKDFDRIAEVVEGREFRSGDRTFLYSHTSPRAVSTPSAWAYVKISEGCSHECAFCSIPLIKGDYQSRPVDSIVAEVESLTAKGILEIDLVSQDTTYYGRDRGETDGLVRLIRELVRLPRLAWVRLLYGYPDEISDALLELLREPKVAPYLDIPVQHSDPAIIRAMKRGMPGRRLLQLLDKIRKSVPDAVLRTSLIVGFPGEGRKEFENLKAFVREARFDHLGVFTYSRETGTTAFDLGDPVPEKTKQNRRDAILEIQARISAATLRAYVGRRLDVLIEGAWKDDPHFLVGRTRFQAPEVDGVVFVDAPSPRRPLPSPLRKVEITASEVYDLRGTLAK